MKVRYGYEYEGVLSLDGKYFEQAEYPLSCSELSVVADGCGGLKEYRITNRPEQFLTSILSLDISVDGERLSPYLDKTVHMFGRAQQVTLQTEAGEVAIATYVAEGHSCVFFAIQALKHKLDVVLNCRGAKAESQKGSAIYGENFSLGASAQGEWVKENDCYYLSGKDEVWIAFGFESKDAASVTYELFEKIVEQNLKEVVAYYPDSAETDEEKTIFSLSYFTALQNFKKVGDFRAFAAGLRYIDPLRTYYRDSYFTVLPMFMGHPELVRDELLTLARGVKEDGSCPSAVKSDFTAFWGDHYDSPSFFVMELFDYVHETGDKSILDEVVCGTSMLQKVKAILARLESRADHTGLLYKEGEFNKRDWADEVCRNGYVTFVEALYYRALVVASRLFKGREDELAATYAARAEKVKQAINDILYDEEKGYYVNYKTADFCEDNLSVDTVFTLLFGIADEKRAKSVLAKMKKLLESKNNKEQGGDFGVMCVYPPDKNSRALCHKSARLFDYHNGANWCYLTAMYAYAKQLFGRDWKSPILSTFRYLFAHGHYSPIEYFSPVCPPGSPLQGWSAAIAFVWQQAGKKNFFA